MAKYKVGDKVRIVDHRTFSMSRSGEMDKWLGKTMTIREITYFKNYFMEEDKCERNGMGWMWDDEMISGLAEQKKPADENLSVTIRFCGRMTVAELYKNGRVVKVKNAWCGPKDDYSRAEGARVAVERLFEKKAGKPKIGDKFVVISNKSPDCRHHFKIGSVVTLQYIEENGKKSYEADNGLIQIVRDRDVAPYREKAN
jgi:hypothetical protein